MYNKCVKHKGRRWKKRHESIEYVGMAVGGNEGTAVCRNVHVSETTEWSSRLSHLSSGLSIPYPMMKCSFSRFVVGLCRATELSAPPSPWITSTMSEDSFDFFLRVMEAMRLRRLSFFLSSRVDCEGG